MSIVDALDVALDAVARAGHSDWVFLPDPDLTPYEHIGLCTSLSDKLEAINEDVQASTGEDLFDIWFSEEQIDALSMAVTVYKSVLLTVNREEIKRRMNNG